MMQNYVNFFQKVTFYYIFFHKFINILTYSVNFIPRKQKKRFFNMKKIKKTSIGLLLVLVVCTSVISCNTDNNIKDEIQEEELAVETKYGLPVERYLIEEGSVGKGDFFGDIMYSAGVDNNMLQKIIEASKEVFDIRKIRVGNSYEFFFEKDSLGGKADAAYFVYEKDAMSHVLFGLKDSVYAKIIDKEILVEKKYTEVKVSTSLWNDVSQAGASPVLALKLSDIYAWTIDFFALQKGDSFKVVYDELSYNGDFIDVDNIRYCEFTHGGKVYTSVMFTDGQKSNVYWNEEGESLRKAFLKAPLQFKRISSKFTYRRKHPVYKVYRPHTGVDYAAPAGTPVMSIGDGVVISKGWGGGGGNTVKIRHNSVYTTAYLHLSRYAKGLKKGDRVKQGQIIGYVGSTGASTGPHLDFRVWKNGAPVDPLKLESPSVEPVSRSNMDAFRATYSAAKNEMDSLATLKYVQRVLEIL